LPLRSLRLAHTSQASISAFPAPCPTSIYLPLPATFHQANCHPHPWRPPTQAATRCRAIPWGTGHLPCTHRDVNSWRVYLSRRGPRWEDFPAPCGTPHHTQHSCRVSATRTRTGTVSPSSPVWTRVPAFATLLFIDILFLIFSFICRTGWQNEHGKTFCYAVGVRYQAGSICHLISIFLHGARARQKAGRKDRAHLGRV